MKVLNLTFTLTEVSFSRYRGLERYNLTNPCVFIQFPKKALSASIVKEVELALRSVAFMSLPSSSSIFQMGKLAIWFGGKPGLFILMEEYAPKMKKKIGKNKRCFFFFIKKKVPIIAIDKKTDASNLSLFPYSKPPINAEHKVIRGFL